FEPALLKGLRGALTRRAYQAADRVICLADGMREMVTTRLGVDSRRVVRIFNPIEPAVDGEASPTDHRTGAGPRLMAIGTLEPRKGFDRILAAMPRLLESRPKATLTIFGEGPERWALEQQAVSLGLRGQVRFAGFSSKAASELRSADLFVLSSRFEGMPNVLLEAIAARCPFVVVDHPGGTREMVELLGAEHRITNDLSEWMPEWFEPLTPRVRQLADQHFSYESIVQQYANVVFPEAAGARLAA
ncbi:MAG TPA: glycosyltransferase, partial [Caulifigura sp.]|nr:glycosyltransferase [Caulifigura sp.]